MEEEIQRLKSIIEEKDKLIAKLKCVAQFQVKKTKICVFLLGDKWIFSVMQWPVPALLCSAVPVSVLCSTAGRFDPFERDSNSPPPP